MTTSRVRLTFGLLVAFCASSGCTTTHNTRTYTDPSIGTKKISSLAILPVLNAPLAQSESIRMNRELAQAVSRRNPSLQILGPAESVEKLNSSGLVEDYDRYVVGLAQSGIPNKATLAKIGVALGVDAIMQGQLLGLHQQDGQFGWRQGSTTFALRYSIVSTRDGMLLWETVEEIRKRRQTTLSSSPQLQEVLPEAMQAVMQSIPAFTFAGATP